jgi:hypothetical protein
MLQEQHMISNRPANIRCIICFAFAAQNDGAETVEYVESEIEAIVESESNHGRSRQIFNCSLAFRRFTRQR